MLIETAVLGAVEVPEEAIYQTPQGLLGFPDAHLYALITRRDGDVTLRWFQAVDAPSPCFVVFDPHEILTDYRPVLEPSDLAHFQGQPQYLLIAVIPEDLAKATVNLKSPIVLDPQTRTARQVIVSNLDYPISFPLVPSGGGDQPVDNCG